MHLIGMDGLIENNIIFKNVYVKKLKEKYLLLYIEIDNKNVS
jgi:hypothetical protein